MELIETLASAGVYEGQDKPLLRPVRYALLPKPKYVTKLIKVFKGLSLEALKRTPQAHSCALEHD